ncbi:hypothetical protein NKI88_02365 [Mesorhizobium sp. M0317]|uniref:hypothetical protein n=1 Tax=Mesorhizobium sp. M0317 TaxID=2956935 RepID=UPI003337909F
MSADDLPFWPTAAAPADIAKIWRCFHCDQVFTDAGCAGVHFGRDESSEPACCIPLGAERSLVGALRRAEDAAAEAWTMIHTEGTEAAKAYWAQHSRHQEQLRVVEEAGYERGLRDARAERSRGSGRR